MIKANGLVYLTEDEWDDEKIRAKYPGALLAPYHTKRYGKGKFARTERFNCAGMNRRQRRHGMRNY